MKFIDYGKLRYEGETTLVNILEEGFGLKNYYDMFNNEYELQEMANSLRKDSILLNKIIAPRLYDICNNVKEILQFDEDIDFYVKCAVHSNAFSINGFGFVPHMIVLNSALIQCITDEELTFVIGHEIGHLIYKHSQLGLVSSILSDSKNKQMNAQVKNTLSRWFKYAEISVDRIGYIAQPNLETIGKVFFKFTSGLSEEHLKFDIKEYLKQLENIKTMARRDFYASHPDNMVRLKCLEFFALSEFYEGALSQDDLQKNTQEILNLLEYHPNTEDKKKIVEFLACVGLYVIHADKAIAPKEREELYNILAVHTSQPENYTNNSGMNEIVERKNAICEYYSNAKNDNKYWLFEWMVYLAVCDGKLDECETAVLLEIAERLQIDEDRVKKTIVDISSEYLAPIHQKDITPGFGNLFQP